MNITLYTNKSAKNVVDKNLTTLGNTLTGYLRSESSLIDPIIRFEGDISTYVHANYMYIAEFGRYYYIKDIKSIRNEIFEITAHVDPLMTYKTELRSLKAVIYRQQNDWNLYVNDGGIKMYQNPHVVLKNFPQGFNTFNFVLAVAGS